MNLILLFLDLNEEKTKIEKEITSIKENLIGLEIDLEIETTKAKMENH